MTIPFSSDHWRFGDFPRPDGQGNGMTIAEWHDAARNALTTRDDPSSTAQQKAHAADVLDQARTAIHAYADGPLHNREVAGDVQDYQSLDPGPLAVDASHALNSLTIGGADAVGGRNWRAFQQLGEEFQPSAAARGDIAGMVASAGPLMSAGNKVAGGTMAALRAASEASPLIGDVAAGLGRVVRPISSTAQTIAAGMGGKATAQEVAHSILASGAAGSVPAFVQGLGYTPSGGGDMSPMSEDTPMLDRLRNAAKAGVGGFIAGSALGGLAGLGSRAADLAAAGRTSRMLAPEVEQARINFYQDRANQIEGQLAKTGGAADAAHDATRQAMLDAGILPENVDVVLGRTNARAQVDPLFKPVGPSSAEVAQDVLQRNQSLGHPINPVVQDAASQGPYTPQVNAGRRAAVMARDAGLDKNEAARTAFHASLTEQQAGDPVAQLYGVVRTRATPHAIEQATQALKAMPVDARLQHVTEILNSPTVGNEWRQALTRIMSQP